MLKPKPGDFCVQAGVNPVLVVSVDDFDTLVDDEARECVVLYGTVFNTVKNTSRRAPHVGSRVPARWLSPVVTLPEPREL